MALNTLTLQDLLFWIICGHIWISSQWIVHNILLQRWNSKQRKNVILAKYPSWIARIFPRTSYLRNGPDFLLKNYAWGTPLAVQTAQGLLVHFSSNKHIRTLEHASMQRLAVHSTFQDITQFQNPARVLTLNNNGSPPGDDLPVRFLRTVVPAHQSQINRRIFGAITTKFTEIFDAAPRSDESWTFLSSFKTATMVVAAANMVVFFGPELSANQEFCQAAVAYSEELFHTAKFLLHLPSLLWPIISRWAIRNPRASDTMVACLTSAVEERQKRLHVNSRVQEGSDYLQFIIDSNIRTGHLTTRDIISVILNSWVIALHETAVISMHALESLGKNPEYIEPLRHETSSFGSLEDIGNLTSADGVKMFSFDEAPLLDSFLKESSRLNPPNSITMRRIAREAVTFKDGTRILTGDMACVTSQAIMRSQKNYKNASKFSAWRFIEDCGHEASPGLRNKSRFTGTELTYPLWGLGKHACPGRFYASAVLKLIILHVLREYDIKLPSSTAFGAHHFSSFIIPNASSVICIRKRQEESVNGYSRNI